MTKLVDLSHEIESEMITYPGLPGPVIRDFMTREASKAHYSEGVTFHIGFVEMVTNTSTYLDTPFHRYTDGFDLENLSLQSCANLRGIVIRCVDLPSEIHPEAFRNAKIRGAAVLFHTGWSKHWRTSKYGEANPYLSLESAKLLAAEGASLVGIDSLNIDDQKNRSRPAHSILLEAGIPIVEHLCNLESLPDSGFKFFAVPPKVKNVGNFPVRAFALIE